MAKKFNSRGTFRGLKVKTDGFSGEVNLRIPLTELREIFVQASLSCLEEMKKERDDEDPEKYHTKLYNYIKGLEEMVMEYGYQLN